MLTVEQQKQRERDNRDLARQCFVLVLDPITGEPIFVDLADSPPRRGIVAIIRTAENGVARPWTKRLMRILAGGRLPHFVVLAEEASSTVLDKWKAYRDELTLRLLEDPCLDRADDLPETIVFSPSNGFETIVDADDLPDISRHRWKTRNPECDTSIILHVCAEHDEPCSCAASSLHRFVAKADKDQIVWHRSGRDDNTKRNLICCSLKPSRKRQDELRHSIQSMINERTHRRGRPKKQHDWRAE